MTAMLIGTAFGSQAQTSFGNPKATDGTYIVKYDMDKGDWAASNDFEIDETFVLAVDITGNTTLEEFIASTSRDPKVIGNGIGFVFYTENVIPEGGATPGPIEGRMKRIKDNIYGVTFNFMQYTKSRYRDEWFGPNADYTEYMATAKDFVTEFNATLFGFRWASAAENGIDWYSVPQDGLFPFKSAAYTGTKTSPEFYKEDSDLYDEDFFLGQFTDWAGYGSPFAYKDLAGSAGIHDIQADTSIETVTTEYFDLQGHKLYQEPANGLFIKKDIKADGSIKASKIIK